MAKLARAVFVKDPDRNRTVVLKPGEEPEPRLAALVTNPDAWEDGKPPSSAEKKTATTSSSDGGEDEGDGSRQATAKTSAARKPARGRKTADEGSGG